MTALFDAHESEFIDAKIAINKSLNEVSTNAGDADRQRSALQLAKGNISEADRFLKLMQVESRTQANERRKAMETKIKIYRDELAGLRKDFERVSLLARSDLSAYDPEAVGFNHRDRMQRSTDLLLGASEKLAESRRILSETEEIGVGVMGNLEEQREVLLSAHGKVKEAKGMTYEAKRILTNLARRAAMNRVFLWAVIAFLVFCILYVTYYDFIRPWFK